ncbi:TonB-dependent outer membrane receptor, SusC/RagA subfamily, signature region [bacterium A37T11]|nr:TonB-dependent outer membrane receptor, SusC/RagA subfamily, signature region [bacterium A37T11]
MEHFYLLVLCLTASSYPCFAQTVSLDVQDKSLDTVLQCISRQTGYGYLTNSLSFEKTLPVRIRFHAKPLLEALELVFEGQPVTYVLRDHCIYVSPKVQSAIELQEVEVTVSNGYFRVSKTQSTGAIDHIGAALLGRNPSGDFMKRLEHTTASLLMNHGDAAQTDAQLIRGRSTIYADARPLIILDHFPYDGDLGNLNPDDFLSVDILKDAAAASLWGARAGNGVIVITTRKGESPKPQLTFGSQLSFQARPDLSTVSTISSADYIALEKQLFAQNRYAADEISPAHAPLTPVVELLIAKRDGKIPAAEADAQIESMKKQDVRKDISKYLYQPAVSQRYLLDISGKTNKTAYYISGSRDQGRGAMTSEQSDRYTVRAVGSSQLTNQLELEIALQYAAQNNKHGANNGYGKPSGALKSLYPYARLADDQGNALPLYLQYRESFVIQAESNGLLNWQYKPLEEIGQEDHRLKRQDGLLQTHLHYHMAHGLSSSLSYQYEAQRSLLLNIHTAESYYARNLINVFAQQEADGTLSFPVPKGGIRDQERSKLVSHQGRIQLDYHHQWLENHQLKAFAGYEIKHLQNSSEESRLTDHFLSAYLQATYAYKENYYLSGSVRKDAANLFGAKTNQKGAPFWSLGAKWAQPHYSLRASVGTQGNIAREASAYTTALSFQSALTKLDYLYIVSPSNDRLSWERTLTVNLGLDIHQLFGCLSGSLDVYRKTANNLLGEITLNPTLGLIDQSLDSHYLGNTAGMTSKGIEGMLSSTRYTNAGLSWRGTIWFSAVRSVLSAYAQQPLDNQPLFGLYSYTWKGLDGQNGDPIGFHDGQLSYAGPATPSRFGAFLHELHYQKISLSFSISYQGGYVFRKEALSYSSLINTWTGSGEYAQRWQQPGDEQHTQIPSLDIKNDATRDKFYQYASIHVLPGDHLRLDNLKVGYACKQVEVYTYINQLGLLWKANKAGIDPFYNNQPADSRCYTLGLKAHF